MQEPALFARLLAHLLAETKPPIWDLERVALAVRGDAAAKDFAVIRDEALRLGYPGAASW